MVYPAGLIGLAFMAMGSTSIALADDIAELAAAGNEAAIQAIDSYYCNITYVTTVGDATGERAAQYWRDKGRVCIRERTTPTLTTDVDADGGKVRIMSTVAGLAQDINDVGLMVDESNHNTVDTDAWQLNLFNFPVMVHRKPSFRVYNLAELVKKGTVKRSEWDKTGGRKVAHLSIELKEEHRAYEVWVDPGYNWLITQCIHTIYDDEGAEFWNIRHVIKEMREIKPSIYLPMITSISFRMKGKQVSTGTAKFEGFRVNETLPPMPGMPFPQGGSIAVDQVDGISYRIDGSGRQAGKAVRIGGTISPIAYPSSRHIRSSPYRVVGWVCAIVAILLVVVALVKRYKSRTDS